MQDQDIIRLYNARNEQAITESSNKYGYYCTSIALNILQNMQDAEECVNDTWLRAWNSIPPAKPDHLQLYLGGITRHISLDRFRRQRAQKRGGGEIVLALDEISDVIASGTDVPTEVAEQEFSESFNRFLWSLPERDCNVFLRRYYYLDPISLIAKRYGLSVANVQKVLSRTRAKLREHLAKEGYAV
ncbi:MAG: RNA polymerase sigma factor [Clostridia bacterium]|nr:RNA polymerase sigma factor [Clostridia bacterium]MBR2447332.1 RNA polymerase sigma factor [Clostridia bacterium]